LTQCKHRNQSSKKDLATCHFVTKVIRWSSRRRARIWIGKVNQQSPPYRDQKATKKRKINSLPYTLRIGTQINAENADFFFLSAKISVFQRPKRVLYGREKIN
jgi:hypothetical protein